MTPTPEQLACVELPLTQGNVALIDATDLALVQKHTWCVARIRNYYYAVTSINRKRVYLHRLLMQPISSEVVDHINRNTLDNRRVNLRKCSHAENMQNRKLQENNMSGHPGVWKEAAKKKWKAKIQRNGKIIYLGSFASKDAAIAARMEAENVIYTD